MVLAMLLGGLRSAEVRGLLLGRCGHGAPRLRVIGKGGKERHVPVDRAFFAELAAYLRLERPPAWPLRSVSWCCAARPPGRRSRRRACAACSAATGRRPGAARVRPHRLRHTYGTELAAAGIDLLALRELMGHASPETTASYVHLSVEQLAAEYGAARATLAGGPR